MRLAIVTAHAGADSLATCLASWRHDNVIVANGLDGMLPAYNLGWQRTDAELVAFFHDDFEIREEGWQDRVEREFNDLAVGVVGFGGALRHGSPDLYKTPYKLEQLGRGGYLSNVDDAEVHGSRFEGVCDVAVLDGFALIVRRSLIADIGGWPVGTPVSYVGYDYWLCAGAHRLGMRCRLIGIRCHHHGGRTAVALKKADGQGPEHAKFHEWFYKAYRDVMPWKCV